MKYCLKHILSFLLVAMMCIALVLPASVQAVSIDLLPYARACLTEVLGFNDEEASGFIFGEQKEDSIPFWHPDHPDWIYTVYIDRKTSRISGTTPFDTGYIHSCSEKKSRELTEDWKLFSDWDQEKLQNLIEALYAEDIPAGTNLLMAEDAGSAVHGFFESCFGPEFGWTEALSQLFRNIMDENGLIYTPESFHQAGIRQGTIIRYGQAAKLTLFEREIPEELKAVLADPHLAEWKCSSGAFFTFVNPPEDYDYPDNAGSGLAAFEKDGRRQLVQLSKVGKEWKIYPLGENALYRSGDYRVTYDGLHESFAVEYQLSDTEKASFFLDPIDWNNELAECWIAAYERLDSTSGKAVWISAGSSKEPTWKQELNPRESAAKARFPYCLGLVPIEQFPVTEEDADRNNYPGVPDQYVLVFGPHFRTGTSSHSHSYGELKPGVIIPVLDVIPGNPDEWIHTRLGTLDGYVVSGYTSRNSFMSSLNTLPAVAEAKKEITVKRGTGWFDGSVGTFPAGTQMHIIFESGDWLYVDIPSGDMNWVMDPDGTFGYVHRNDVTEMTSACLINWPEE